MSGAAMTRLLIVDDSALMRQLITHIFSTQDDFEIHTARNGVEAVSKNRLVQPDVITLDINMPEMDGLDALALIMAERPVPVVMLSSLTRQGALATFEALNLGAVDFIAKPDGTISLSLGEVESELIAKVKAASRARLRKFTDPNKQFRHHKLPDRSPPPATQEVSTTSLGGRQYSSNNPLVLIGVSTGGPRTLEEILPQMPANFPFPIVVAQHMPANFTRSLAERLNRYCQMEVLEANAEQPLLPGHIYIAAGNKDVVLANQNGGMVIKPVAESPDYTWHPSVERLAQSALQYCQPRRIMAVMLTGMGRDGSEAYTKLFNSGAETIAESEDTAVVFGMPDALIRAGGASHVLPANAIAERIVQWSKTQKAR
ncbi:protein-glutamate methylesterase/protein-glutamine glutaminase [Parathalassolituus penaei]|uniref:Protein-glutamate methylesterase/protein-glutamine glutaminase n=1 Tax=Parathalassolituus penaei TaxID=2997323 RepID=A0A9X3IT44_9GAMM|nr:chemotaxis response regulator protein-glutamate methylesterase [Parathalassolituus penaei]MCY0965529.1 chemotaxis response regulator protein-glutamate methylesterase [Parathalassolituus penaei]